MPLPPTYRRLLVTLASCALLAAVVIGFRAAFAPPEPAGPKVRLVAADGWFLSLADAREAARATGRPLAVLWGRATPDRYERSVRPASAALADRIVFARVDVASDTPEAERLGLRAVPTLLVLDPHGFEVTRLEGRRETDEVERTLARVAEVPLPRAALEVRAVDDVSALRRLVEVYLESEAADSALRAAEDLVRRSSTAADTLLLAKALVETRRLEPAAEAAEAVVRADSTLAPEARWVRLVALMNLGRDAEVARTVESALRADASSPYARRILLAYGVEYLVKARKRLREGIAFLEGYVRRHPGSPHAAEVKLAAANLHGLLPDGAKRALVLYGEALDEGDARVVEAAEETLVEWATSPQVGQAAAAAAILRPRLDAAGPEAKERLLFHVAALEATAGETEAAIARWRAVAEGESERADDALLALALYHIDGEADLAAGRAPLEALLDRFGNRETATAARFHLGRVLLFSGEFEAAARQFEALAGRADAFGEEARRHLDLLGEARQDEETARRLVAALVRRAHGDLDGSTSDLRALVEGAPSSPLADDALLEIAKTSLARRDRAGAERALRRILAEYRTSNQYPAAEALLAHLAGRPPARGR